MKKLIAMLLALVMVFGLVACGGNTTEETKAPETQAQNQVATPAETEAEAETPAAAGRVYWLNFKPESDEALKTPGCHVHREDRCSRADRYCRFRHLQRDPDR